MKLISKNDLDKYFEEDKDIIIGLYMIIYKNNTPFDIYIEKIKNLINDENKKNEIVDINLENENENNKLNFYSPEDRIIDEDYIEININDWENLKNNMKSGSFKEFEIGYYKWKIKLKLNDSDSDSDSDSGSNYEEYISIYLKNLKMKDKDKNTCVCVKFVFIVRSINNDYSYYYTRRTQSFVYYKNLTNSHGFGHFIKMKDLENDYIKDSNKIVIGAYIRIYDSLNYDEEKYVNTLKKMIKNDENFKIKDENHYKIYINNWNKILLKNSPIFIIGNYLWYIGLFPEGNGDSNYFSIYLYNKINEKANNDKIYANFVLSIRNQNNYSQFEAKNTINFSTFEKKNNKYGFDKFIETRDLYNVKENFRDPIIKNESVIIDAYIRVYYSNKNGDIYQEKPLINNNDPNCKIALKDYFNNDDDIDYLEISKGDYLKIIEWNLKNDNVFGFKINDPENKGIFPKDIFQK